MSAVGDQGTFRIEEEEAPPAAAEAEMDLDRVLQWGRGIDHLGQHNHFENVFGRPERRIVLNWTVLSR
jgi:hypothetical protein